MWAKITRYYPPWLDLIGLLLLSTAFSYVRAHYDQLPATIPTHFGGSGLPDAWNAKSWWTVYGTLVIGLAIYLSMVILNVFFIIRPDDPARILNIPKSSKEMLGPERLEAIRAFTVRAMVALNLILAAMFAYLGYGMTGVALGVITSLGPLMWVFTALILMASLYMTIGVITMSSTRGIKRSG
ncbi:MAG: DUF1648 domain-containing protein [Syntrophomonas sp.]|nr:DUF1648 domain-containing protein [Syntrophomonas sp.]